MGELDEALARALINDRVIDITTTGRRSGRDHRQEIWVYNTGCELYITGVPGPRDWYANMLASPGFTFHLKRTAKADLPARAVPVRDKARRREVLQRIYAQYGGSMGRDLDRWVEGCPLVQVHLEARHDNEA